MNCPDHEYLTDDCLQCEASLLAIDAEFRGEWEAATPAERQRVMDPEGARAAYRQEMIDAGRGHLLREDER
jgi:hypothetical protein